MTALSAWTLGLGALGVPIAASFAALQFLGGMPDWGWLFVYITVFQAVLVGLDYRDMTKAKRLRGDVDG